ncbi:MAG TPA: KilA-N domain-containing protein, partial [Catalimonadaceae bacterium]|nr:KilA-N domain-containing protein [Catalimonadaceae bacterium]
MDTLEFIDATAELKAYNLKATSNKAIAEFWSNKGTKNAILYLKEKTGIPIIYECRRGRGGGTWMHPELFVYFQN